MNVPEFTEEGAKAEIARLCEQLNAAQHEIAQWHSKAKALPAVSVDRMEEQLVYCQQQFGLLVEAAADANARATTTEIQLTNALRTIELYKQWLKEKCQEAGRLEGERNALKRAALKKPQHHKQPRDKKREFVSASVSSVPTHLL
jgi:hypothetical protein